MARATKKDAGRFVKQIQAFSGLFGLFQPVFFFLRHLFLILSVKISRPKKMPVFFHSLNDLFAALVVPIITAVPVFVVVRIALVCVIVMVGLVRAVVRISCSTWSPNGKCSSRTSCPIRRVRVLSVRGCRGKCFPASG